MKMLLRRLTILTMALASHALPPSCAADDALIDTARTLAAELGKGIITVEAVAEITIEGTPPREQQFSIPGTVIDASGLTIVSRSSMFAVESLLRRRIRQNIETNLSDFVLIFGDGTEVDAKLVLTDEKLDVAFVAPEDELDEEDAALFTPILLPHDEQQVELLDNAIVIGRTNKSLDRSVTVRVARVNSIVTKPRTLYLGDFGSQGFPVFNTSGELIGITGAIKTSYAERLTPVIPAHDLSKVAAQAKDAPELKAAERADTDDASRASPENPESQEEGASEEDQGAETAGKSAQATSPTNLAC